MRIAVLVIGLVLTLGLFIQAFVIFGLSDAIDQEDTQAAGSVGVLMALMWVVGCGLVIPVPRVSMVLFAVAGLLGFAASGNYPDLAWWGGISEILAVFCYFGYRGKRKSDRKDAERDALMRKALSARQQRSLPATDATPNPPSSLTFACPRCGERLPVTAKFCSSCGLAFGLGTTS
jgi:hypothetical protein